MTDPATTWREVLRAHLLTARKTRDPVRTSALRSALAAIDNAETPDVTVGRDVTEVDRRQLNDDEVRALLRAEIDERLSAETQLTSAGAAERAAAVRAEADVIAGLLEDVRPA